MTTHDNGASVKPTLAEEIVKAIWGEGRPDLLDLGEKAAEAAERWWAEQDRHGVAS